MKVYSLIALILLLSCTTSQSQNNNERLPSSQNNSVIEHSARIKWTWQLPTLVKNTFNRSTYANWYVERMISFDVNGKIVYRFYLNNGNLLDDDHYYNFLETDSIDISADGTFFNNNPLIR